VSGVASFTSSAASKPDALLVDSDRFFMEAVAQRFVSAGFDVRTAASRNEALTAMRDRTPSVVVADLEFGANIGHMIIVDMKLDANLKDIPIIAVSRGRPIKGASVLEAMGVFRVLAKDEIVLADLVGAAREALVERRAERRTISPYNIFVLATALMTAVFFWTAVAIIAAS